MSTAITPPAGPAGASSRPGGTTLSPMPCPASSWTAGTPGERGWPEPRCGLPTAARHAGHPTITPTRCPGVADASAHNRSAANHITRPSGEPRGLRSWAALGVPTGRRHVPCRCPDPVPSGCRQPVTHLRAGDHGSRRVVVPEEISGPGRPVARMNQDRRLPLAARSAAGRPCGSSRLSE